MFPKQVRSYGSWPLWEGGRGDRLTRWECPKQKGGAAGVRTCMKLRKAKYVTPGGLARKGERKTFT